MCLRSIYGYQARNFGWGGRCPAVGDRVSYYVHVCDRSNGDDYLKLDGFGVIAALCGMGIEVKDEIDGKVHLVLSYCVRPL